MTLPPDQGMCVEIAAARLIRAICGKIREQCSIGAPWPPSQSELVVMVRLSMLPAHSAVPARLGLKASALVFKNTKPSEPKAVVQAVQGLPRPRLLYENTHIDLLPSNVLRLYKKRLTVLNRSTEIWREDANDFR